MGVCARRRPQFRQEIPHIQYFSEQRNFKDVNVYKCVTINVQMCNNKHTKTGESSHSILR